MGVVLSEELDRGLCVKSLCGEFSVREDGDVDGKDAVVGVSSSVFMMFRERLVRRSHSFAVDARSCMVVRRVDEVSGREVVKDVEGL